MLENYKLCEFFSISNAMGQVGVDKLVSKTVRSLYMNVKIAESNS
jgi:hypothetical protein